MKNVTYRHARTGATSTFSGPVLGMEASEAWQRVEGPNYARMKKGALVELCAQRSLDPAGTVPELAERLDAYDVAHAAEPDAQTV